MSFTMKYSPALIYILNKDIVTHKHISPPASPLMTKEFFQKRAVTGS